MKSFLLLLAVIICLIPACVQPGGQPEKTVLPVAEPNMTGRDGSSIERAIPIAGAQNDQEATRIEYLYLEQQFGERGKVWVPMTQEYVTKDNRKYDLLRIQFSNLTQRDVYFDISAISSR